MLSFYERDEINYEGIERTQKFKIGTQIYILPYRTIDRKCGGLQFRKHLLVIKHQHGQ